jgi:hypothetical protein
MSTFYAVQNKKTGKFAQLFNLGTEVSWTTLNSFKLFENKEELEDLIRKAREYRRYRGIKLWYRTVSPRDIEIISVEERYMRCGRCNEDKPAFVSQYCNDCEDAEEHIMAEHYSLTNRLKRMPGEIRWTAKHWMRSIKATRKLRAFGKQYGLKILKTPKGYPHTHEDGSTSYSHPQIKERIIGDNPGCRFIWSHGVGDIGDKLCAYFDAPNEPFGSLLEFDPNDGAACMNALHKIGFSAHDIAAGIEMVGKQR